ncbi:MAG: hypothetical protein HY704_12980 [Gemmatimonadetes bacterium]|nr:hypothetical protein [Gemmatimonadota bacterium]
MHRYERMSPGRVERLRRGRAAGTSAAAVLLVAAIASATGAAVRAQAPRAEQSAPQELLDARWLPWVGCWTTVTEESDEPAPPGPERGPVVCVRPEISGVEVVTVARGEVLLRRALRAGSERRPVEEAGCAGWETAHWSGDGRRMYVRSQLQCEGGVQRTSSGASLFLPGGQWLDVQAVAAGGEPAVIVRRYRPADDDALREAGVPPVMPEKASAIATARLAAVERISVGDVKEAVREVDPEVVEVMLAERGAGFALDSRMLLDLADAGVPGEITDLMIALSNPRVFEVQPGERTAISRVRSPAEPPSGRAPAYAGVGPYGYDPWFGYGYSRFFYSPLGLGYPYDYWGYRIGGPIILLREQGDREDGVEGSRGRVVNGRGYTRGGARAGARSAGGRPSSWTGSGRGGSRSVQPARGGATPRGHERGSSSGSTGRTAKARPPGG